MKNNRINKAQRSFFLGALLFLTSFLSTRTFKKINIQDVEIFGANFLSREDIFKNLSHDFPTPLILFKTKHTEKELKKNLSLKNVSIERHIFPHSLKIFIEARKPIAYGEKFVNKKKVTGYIDEEGFFIPQEYADIESNNTLFTKITGWEKKFKEFVSKILKYQNNHDIKFSSIDISRNGFLILEEKSLRKILLGFDPKIIETQLRIISNIKNQLNEKKLIEKIDNLDLTDPNNPKIKVFKP